MTVTMGYSVDTLAAQLRGIADVDPDAAGGTVPDRIKRDVREFGAYLYNLKPWRFRSVQGTLSIAAGSSAIALAADFDKLDQQVMQATDLSTYEFLWTDNPARWQRARDMLSSTDTGVPQIAVPYWDEDSAAWKAMIAPTADDTYTYPYWYLRRDPWHRATPVEDDVILSATGLWPHAFDVGWQLLCEYRILKHYKGEEAAAPSYRAFKGWVEDHYTDNDQTQAVRRDRIQDVFMHQQGTTSGSAWFIGLPGWPGGWYGVSI